MKFKTLAVMAAAAMVAGSASAGVNVNWYVTYGVYPNGSPDVVSGTPGSGLLGSNGTGSTILQLVYAGLDGIIDAVDPNNAGNGYAGGDDVVWETRVAVDGANYDEWVVAGTTPNPFTDPTFTAGFVYARVFQDQTPIAGEYYYDTATVAINNLATDPAFAQSLYIGDSAGGFGVELDTQIVPEPSAVILAGLGALMLAVRRRRQA